MKIRATAVTMLFAIQALFLGQGCSTQGSTIRLTVHGMNGSDEKPVILRQVSVPVRSSLEAKVGVLTKELSAHFKLPVQLVGIVENDGKKVARVDLQESEGNRKATKESDRLRAEGKEAEGDEQLKSITRPTWSTGYFQGSTGGTCTGYTLMVTLLQPGGPAAWIDGVEFLYEGTPMGGWDHILLEGIIWRSKLKLENGVWVDPTAGGEGEGESGDENGG